MSLVLGGGNARQRPAVRVAVSTCVLRVGLAWALPAVAAAVSGSPLDDISCVVAAAASLVEVLVWLCHRSKDLRRLVTCSVARRASYVVRCGFLLLIQLYCLRFGPGAVAAWPAPPARATPLAVPRPANRGAERRKGSRSAAPTPPSASGPPPSTTVPRQRHAQADFQVDADPATLRWSPRTISVVLPCAEEREYALKTVKAVFHSTPRDVLREIVVVDDGSKPPLAETHLGPEVQKKYGVRVLRHERTVGLMGAKKTGGDAMVGDIGAFFDCHVAPQPGWHESFLKLIGENYRRLVVPQITSLDLNTWTQAKGSQGVAKCYLTWDADFKWFDSNDRFTAVTSGGLLGMSKRWWVETGGYDEHMLGWGGENLDQALRIWLCGGEIVTAPESQVAHMWRSGDPRTNARYRHVGDTTINRARAVYAWYGDFAKKLGHFPDFARRSSRSGKTSPWYGNISNILAIRDRLKCRPFAWFLRRFKFIYEGAGLIPQEVFMLREERTGKCLRFKGRAGTAPNGMGEAALTSCEPKGDADRLFWHRGNHRGPSGACCSGLRAWNTEQCLQDVADRRFKTGVCDISGRNEVQHWALRSSGELRHGRLCAGADEKGALRKRPCAALARTGSRWTKLNVTVPLEMRLYLQARRAHPAMFERLDRDMARLAEAGGGPKPCGADGGCLQLLRPGGGGECLGTDMEWTAEPEECCTFRFKAASAGAGRQLWGSLRQDEDVGRCLDRWNDEDPLTWGLAGCHRGVNQQLRIMAGGKGRICDINNQCFSYRNITADQT